MCPAKTSYTGLEIYLAYNAKYMAWHLRKKPSGIKKISPIKPVKPIQPIKPIKAIRPISQLRLLGMNITGAISVFVGEKGLWGDECPFWQTLTA